MMIEQIMRLMPLDLCVLNQPTSPLIVVSIGPGKLLIPIKYISANDSSTSKLHALKRATCIAFQDFFSS